MRVRRYGALGLGSLFIWWGLHGGLTFEVVGVLLFGLFFGGFLAALGSATNGFDGAVDAVVALAVVIVFAGSGLVGWALYRHGLGAVWLAGDAVAIVSLAIVKRHNFLLPVLIGGAVGGFVNGRYIPA